MGKCLPGLFILTLATISFADECADKIIEFINAHAPGVRELVFFFFFELSFTLKPFFLETSKFVLLYLFSGVEEATRGEAPVDQSVEEGPKGTSTDPTSSPSCPPDISQSPPHSPSTVPLYSSPPTISPITISLDIPIRVEYLPDSVSVPSPIFLLQGYSSPISTLSSTSVPMSRTFSTITNPTKINLSDQNVPHLASLSKPTPILGSFSISPQTLSDSHPSNFSSLDILPPLSSSIIHDQVMSSCSFATSIVVPPSSFASSSSHNTSFPRKSRGGRLVEGKSSRGVLLGVDPQGEGGEIQGSFPHPLLILAPAISLFPSLYLSPPRDTFLRKGLDFSTKPRVSDYFPHTPSANPYFTNYSCSPKIFSPIVSFNEPSEYYLTCFPLLTLVTSSLDKTIGPC